MRGFAVAHLDDLARIPVDEGLEWRPIRRRFGISAFGVNAYTSRKVGDWVVEEHREGSGHEELYLVLCGRARFTLDGEDVDAPAGTIVFLPDSTVLRVARAEEEGTTVLAVGGWPDRPFEPSGWEWRFEAEALSDEGRHEEALAIMSDYLERHADNAPALYHTARFEARAGRTDDARAHLRRALELAPEVEGYARDDVDLAALL